MLTLLCSAPRVDEYDPYPSPPSSPSRIRRASRSLSFISQSAKKRKVSKLSIGTPEGFRHEFHMGKDVATPNTRLDLWDSARWQQEIAFHEKLQTQTSSTSTPSIAASASSIPSNPPRGNISKRNSITPQRRKPVPSIIPDMPAIFPFASPALAPQDVALPPSPTDAQSEEPAEPPKSLVPLLDPPRRGPSADDGERLYVTETVKARWDNAMGEIEKALQHDSDEA